MKRSFTLIESLVCISLLGIVVISLLPAIYNGLTMKKNENDDIEEILRIQSSLEQVKSDYFAGKDISTNSETYKISEDHDLYTISYYIDGNLEDPISLTLPKDISMY